MYLSVFIILGVNHVVISVLGGVFVADETFMTTSSFLRSGCLNLSKMVVRPYELILVGSIFRGGTYPSEFEFPTECLHFSLIYYFRFKDVVLLMVGGDLVNFKFC